MFVAVLAGFTLGHGSSLAASKAPAAHQRITVEPGETLWSVAARVAPHDDPRIVVADIESYNHLRSAGIEAGQQLVIPRIG
jgi:LysM repeat protein